MQALGCSTVIFYTNEDRTFTEHPIEPVTMIIVRSYCSAYRVPCTLQRHTQKLMPSSSTRRLTVRRLTPSEYAVGEYLICDHCAEKQSSYLMLGARLTLPCFAATGHEDHLGRLFPANSTGTPPSRAPLSALKGDASSFISCPRTHSTVLQGMRSVASQHTCHRMLHMLVA